MAYWLCQDPYVCFTHILPLGAILSTQRVLRVFPSFSQLSGEVVCLRGSEHNQLGYMSANEVDYLHGLIERFDPLGGREKVFMQ
jgi:hypothetical protein